MNTKRYWIGIILITTLALLTNFVPAWIIQPFKTQAPGAVELSFLFRKWSPIVTFILFLVNGVLLAMLLKRTNRWWKKSVAILFLLLTGIFAWFSRQNYYEWMFRPLPDAAYVRPDGQKFATDNDMVLAMSINGDAVAYPVRLLAYHHIVNDTVGGKPVVATY